MASECFIGLPVMRPPVRTENPIQPFSAQRNIVTLSWDPEEKMGEITIRQPQPKHAVPNLPIETRSRTKSVSRTRRPPPEKIPRMERTRSETLKLFVVSDVGRRSR